MGTCNSGEEVHFEDENEHHDEHAYLHDDDDDEYDACFDNCCSRKKGVIPLVSYPPKYNALPLVDNSWNSKHVIAVWNAAGSEKNIVKANGGIPVDAKSAALYFAKKAKASIVILPEGGQAVHDFENTFSPSGKAYFSAVDKVTVKGGLRLVFDPEKLGFLYGDGKLKLETRNPNKGNVLAAMFKDFLASGNKDMPPKEGDKFMLVVAVHAGHYGRYPPKESFHHDKALASIEKLQKFVKAKCANHHTGPVEKIVVGGDFNELGAIMAAEGPDYWMPFSEDQVEAPDNWTNWVPFFGTKAYASSFEGGVKDTLHFINKRTKKYTRKTGSADVIWVAGTGVEEPVAERCGPWGSDHEGVIMWNV